MFLYFKFKFFFIMYIIDIKIMKNVFFKEILIFKIQFFFNIYY